MAAHSADVPLRARLEEAAGDVVHSRQRCRAHHGERGGHSGRRSLGRWHRGQGQRDSRGGPRARTRVRTCARSRVRPRARPRALLRARTRASPRRESARGIARGIARDIASKVARRRARSRARSRARHRARDRGASRVAARGATRGGPPRDSLTRRDSLCVSDLPTIRTTVPKVRATHHRNDKRGWGSRR